jgi:hypothetical protein
MEKLILILIFMSFLSFGCSTTGSLYFENLCFKCTNCYNQDTVKDAVNTYFDKKYGKKVMEYNYTIETCYENEEFWFINYRAHPTGFIIRDCDGAELTISKKLCKIVKVYECREVKM